MDITNKKILFAVLNWGIGHATRSTVLINRLLGNGNEVVLASSAAAGLYLQREFPDLKYHELSDYNITYKSKYLFYNAIVNFSKFKNAIQSERNQLETILANDSFDFIISDNRYGMHHKSIKSILLTHQLRLLLPRPFAFLSFLSSGVLNAYFRPFDEIWIPDFEGDSSLSGKLSKPFNLHKTVRFIGPLSRFSKSSNMPIKPEYDFLFILSGPEPARSSFEKLVLKQALESKKKILIIRGLQNSKKLTQNLPANISTIQFAHTTELQKYIALSKIIVMRSGYSSIMDFEVLGRKALLVPTPGQSEQEYLAQYHAHVGKYDFVKEKNFSIEKYSNS